MLKRFAACLMALALLMSCTALGEETSETPAYDSLTVGSTTQMQGEFFTQAWGNATSDTDVRDLLHGYNLVRWDAAEGCFRTDESVVSGFSVGETAEGDRSYIVVLNHNLYYSDGTQITAWDYAFSFLLRISPEMKELGAAADDCPYLYGWNDYISGREKALAGIRVTAEDTLTITVHHDYLPFFYELGWLSCKPYPIHVIAPGVSVRDDGAGVYLANKDPEATETVFTAELLIKTVCDPESGYRSHPSVVSGPYTLASWDGTTATFEINPYFKGDFEGKKPLIQHLTYTLTTNETMMEELQTGKLGLLNKVTDTQAIQQGIGAVGSGAAGFSNYPRLGLSYISFCCEKDTVSSQAVRQAIAWCLDRDQVVQDYTGNFGLRADGYYGIGQWTYEILNGTLAYPVNEEDDPETAAAYAEEWEALSLEGLTVYSDDPAKAAELLEADGWKLNEQGIREKETGGEKVTLDLTLVYPAGSRMGEMLKTLLIPNLEEAGIRLTLQEAEMPDLLAMYYRQVPRENDMFFLASNFDLVFDPSNGFETENGIPTWRNTGCADETLYSLASDMRKTTPGDTLAYCIKWVEFQKRFNEVLPMLPLYSNVYFDFYTPALHDYVIQQNVGWGQAILGASLYDEVEEEDGEEF